MHMHITTMAMVNIEDGVVPHPVESSNYEGRNR